MIDENYSVIIKEIDSLIEDKNYEEALKLCNNYKLSMSTGIEKRIMLINRKIGNFDICHEISSKDYNKNNAEIQGEEILTLIKEGKLKEALDITNNPLFTNNSRIMSQKVNLLEELDPNGTIEERLEILNNNNFKKDAIIQYKIIKIYMEQKEYLKALVIANRDYFKNDALIQLCAIEILDKKRRQTEALEICEKKAFEDNIDIQLKKTNIYLKLGKIDDAVQSYINIINKFDKFKKIDVLENNNKIINYRIKLEKENNNDNKTLFISKLLTKIYTKKIKEEEIINADLNEWTKELLLISYKEKNNLYPEKYIKNLKKKYINDNKKTKALNIIYSDIATSKNKYFNVGKYEKILNVYVNFDLVDDLAEKNEIVNTTEKRKIKEENKVIVKEKKKNNKKKNNYIVVEGQHVNNRFNREYNKSDKNIDPKKTDEDKNIKSNQMIKDLFPNEIDIIRKQLYILMQKSETQEKAIKAWDYFERLINSKVTDERKLLNVIYYINRFSSIPNLGIEGKNKEEYVKKLK